MNCGYIKSADRRAIFIIQFALTRSVQSSLFFHYLFCVFIVCHLFIIKNFFYYLLSIIKNIMGSLISSSIVKRQEEMQNKMKVIKIFLIKLHYIFIFVIIMKFFSNTFQYYVSIRIEILT